MSSQAKNKHATPTKVIKTGSEAPSTSKKRKHNSDSESSKKKKKQRTDDVAGTPAAIRPQPVELKEKKKKILKSRDRDETVAQSAEEVQNVELPDVPTAQNGRDKEAEASSLESYMDSIEALRMDEEEVLGLLESEDPSSFYSTRISLHLPIPAISLEAGMSSILAVHLGPLLLTYFPPAQGIVLGFSDPVLSAKPSSGINLPLFPPRTGHVKDEIEVFARTADELGVCWIWLTANFLVFQPQRGDKLYGWTNVSSEGFMGLVSYNYFQAAVGKTRIPGNWKWSGVSGETENNKKKGRKGRLRDDDRSNGVHENDKQERDTTLVDSLDFHMPLGDDNGYFADANGTMIESTLGFRVVDTDVVPGHDRYKWSLQIEATLLDEEAEKVVVEAERAKFEQAQERSRSRSPSAGDHVVMSGALRRSLSREESVASRTSARTPARHRLTY